MQKTFRFLAEDTPGAAWCDRFRAGWPGGKEWYLKDGLEARPSRAACSRAFDRHMPELKPMWRRLCKLVGDGDLESRSLSHWSPPNVFDGCSVAVLNPTDDPVLVRNYDFDPGFTGTEILRSDWSGRAVIGLNEGSWGLLDGMNDDGLVACLTFGGRPVCGTAFSVILVLRYVLETCATAAQARDTLLRLRTHLQQNIVVLDASGDHFTAMMGPDRDTRIWQTSVTTNHPQTVEWQGHAERVHSVARYEYLCDRLEQPAAPQCFFESPLYSTGYESGFGTVYTSLYWPGRRELAFRWPGREVRQSFEDFAEIDVPVEFVEGQPAFVKG